MGGSWGPELKYAGYDALIIEGKSKEWVNLWICNDRVEFRSAKEYVGQDTYSTQVKLRKELDPSAKILCIGPAGEKLSRLAVILSDSTFASGRSGFGAVMGSKKLKAIAVRGTKPLKVFDPNRLIDISTRVRYLSANNPMQEWTTRVLKIEDQKEFINKYRKKNTACFSCPSPCFAHLEVPGAGESASHCANYYYHGAATKFYGHSMERDQAVSDSYVLANRFGLDTFEFRQMIKFLDDLHKKGLIEPQKGLPLDKIGSREFIQKLLYLVSAREGIGDILAEGCARTADQIGGGWDVCSKYFPAYGSADHGAIRKQPGVALLWALDSRCPLIDQHAYSRLSSTYQTEPQPFTLSAERAKSISKQVFGSDMAIDHTTFNKKPEAVIYAQNRSAVINILIVCDWVYPVIQSYATADRMGDTSLESKLLFAVTGHNLTEEELNTVGERIWNLGRAMMVREGRTRDDDTLHESYFAERDGEQAVSKTDFEQAKTVYYKLRGWDKSKGWPTSKKLNEVGLSDIARDLEKEGINLTSC
jgi:aldehyde:ferredoxin oxidoreductase